MGFPSGWIWNAQEREIKDEPTVFKLDYKTEYSTKLEKAVGDRC